MSKGYKQLMAWMLSGFGVIGAVVITVACFIITANARFIATAGETDAVITDISTRTGGRSSGTSRSVSIKFSVNGAEYKGGLDYWSTGMAVGKTVKIYYDLDNPQNFRSKSGASIAGLIVLGLGVVFFLVAVIPLFIVLAASARNKKLLANGKRLLAKVKEVADGSIEVNGAPSSRLICEYKDEASGKTYVFKSENVWLNSSVQNRISNFETLPPISVYADYNDYSKYCVDVKSFIDTFDIVDLT